MITDQDTEIFEKEESLRLRLTEKFMNSIGVDIVHNWSGDFLVYVPRDKIYFPKGEHIVVHPADIVLNSRVVWYDIAGYRIIGKVQYYSKMKECYHVLVERVDKLTNPKL